MAKVKVKIFTGDYIICQCVGRGKKRRCKPKGQAYRFPGYYYVWMEEAPQAPKENTPIDEIDVNSSNI